MSGAKVREGKRPAAPAPGHTIVAEISKGWINGESVEVKGLPSLLSQRFELAIAHNAGRGYQLRDWQLSRVANALAINETIIAVFEYSGSAALAASREE